jgi:hypothetical protein
LPFEVTYSESEKSKNMNRLAFIVKPENLEAILSSLREMGATIYDVKRVGKDSERVTSCREVVLLI